MRKILLLPLMLIAAGTNASAQQETHPQWQQAASWPDRIIATLPGDPQTSFAVNWRTDTSVGDAVAQIMPATDGPLPDEEAQTVSGSTETLDLENVGINGERFTAHWNVGLGSVNYHSVTFDGLQPDTLYAYRVRGGEGEWSEWFHLRTAPEAGPVSFIYVGDAQNDILEGWSRVIREAFAEQSDARFIVHAGDLVNKGDRDRDWAEWYRALGFIHSMIPAIPATGNHEYPVLEDGDRESDREINMFWRPQFALPVEPDLPPELAELAYDVRYSKDVHVFIITSTDDEHMREQAEWLDRELAASDAAWKVVSFHHPIFSSHEGRDTPEKRDILLPVFLRNKVDLVLQGHDHTYARGAIGEPADRLGFRDEGAAITTMFVNSVAGPKQYDFKPTDWNEYLDTGVRLARSAEDTQLFQTVHIDGDTLRFESRTATGALYDDFVLRKQADGTKIIAEGAHATMDERRTRD